MKQKVTDSSISHVQTPSPVSLWSIFWVMWKIGTFTIGGGYAMLLMIQKELTSRKWIPDDEFTDLIALSQAAPGLLAVNISIFAGHRLRGVPGAVVATIGSCMSPFLFILLIAAVFSNYADNPIVLRIFAGMRPAVVALILVPMITTARKGCKTLWQWALAAAALGAVAFLKISPVYVLLAIILGSIITLIATGHRPGKAADACPSRVGKDESTCPSHSHETDTDACHGHTHEKGNNGTYHRHEEKDEGVRHEIDKKEGAR